MEIIRGKQTSFIDTTALAAKLVGYDRVHIDIGTGDGRFVRHIAQNNPGTFVIGIDACRENLVAISRRAPSNSLFVIANARALPTELFGSATQVTINFPWGSLFDGLAYGRAYCEHAFEQSHSYKGLEPSRYGRPGRIPRSVNVPAATLIDPATKTFVPLADAEQKFAAQGFSRDKRVVAYCGGGISATIDLFMLHRLGYDKLTLYDASMGEWAVDNKLPIEVG